MRFFLLFLILFFSLRLMSQTSKEAGPSTDVEEGYYSDEERDPVVIEGNEDGSELREPECNCDTIQAQEEPPVYVIMPPPIPQQQVAPTGLDYSVPQIGPDFYKQYQSGNYQYQGFPSGQ